LIVVDSAVWIDWINGRGTRQTAALQSIVLQDTVLLGDLVLCEVLMGARSESDAVRIGHELSRFRMVELSSADVAARAARHYRALRARGITIRSTIDLLIGTFCIAHGHALLHRDRDFDVMEHHLGLSVVRR
jgi:predicted nucleic acid-binding protein